MSLRVGVTVSVCPLTAVVCWFPPSCQCTVFLIVVFSGVLWDQLQLLWLGRRGHPRREGEEDGVKYTLLSTEMSSWCAMHQPLSMFSALLSHLHLPCLCRNPKSASVLTWMTTFSTSSSCFAGSNSTFAGGLLM